MTWRTDNLSATALSNINNGAGNIYTLVEFDYPTGTTRRYSTRTITAGGNAYSRRVIGFPAVNQQEQTIHESLSNGTDNFPQPYCQIDIDDSASYSERLTNLFRVTSPEGCTVRIYTFLSGGGAGESDRILDGVLRVFDWSEPERYVIRLHLIGLLAGIENRKLGRVLATPTVKLENYSVISLAEYAAGRIIPYVFGEVRNSPLIGINGGATSNLYVNLPASSGVDDYVVITKGDAADFPKSGKVQIGEEVITYSGKITSAVNYDALVIVGRSNPIFHAEGTMVAEVPKYWSGGYDSAAGASYGWVYVAADHKIKELSNLRVNGRVVDSSLFTEFSYSSDPAIKWGGENVSAVVFDTLPRISAIGHNVNNTLNIDGLNYTDYWEEGDENNAGLPLYAVGNDDSLPAVLGVAEGDQQIHAVNFTGDLSDGSDRYGDIKQVRAVIEYASTAVLEYEEGVKQAYLTLSKNNAQLVHQQNDANKIPSPQEDDIRIGGLDHDHDIDIESYTDLDDDLTSYLTIEAIADNTNIGRATSVTGTSGWESWHYVNYELWGYSEESILAALNRFPAVEDATYYIEPCRVTTGAYPYPDDAGLNYWIDQSHIPGTSGMTFSLADGADGDYDQVNIKALLWGGRRRSTVPDSGYTSATFTFVLLQAGTVLCSWNRSVTDQEVTQVEMIYTPSENLTKEDVDAFQLAIYPIQPTDYGSRTNFAAEKWRIYGLRFGVRQTEESAQRIITEAEIAMRYLQGAKLSSRLRKVLDVTDIIGEWATGAGETLWDFFSNCGGRPGITSVLTGQEEGIRLLIYDAKFEIEYAPLISFGEDVTVTATIEGACDGSDYLYETPADIANLLLIGNDSVGVTGLGLDSYVDSTEQSTVAGYQESRGYVFARAVHEQISYVELIYQILRESRTELPFELGKFVFKWLPTYLNDAGNTITADDILAGNIEIERTPTDDLANRVNLFYSENLEASGYWLKPTDRFNKVLQVESAASQSEGWGVQERDVELYWHNNKTTGQAGTQDLANWIIGRRGYKLLTTVIEMGIEGMKYGLGDIITITNSRLGLNATPCQILERQIPAPHRRRFRVMFQLIPETVVWQDATHSGCKIVPALGGAFWYWYIGSSIFGKLDMDGNFWLTGEVYESSSHAWPDAGSSEFWADDAEMINLGYARVGGGMISKCRWDDSGSSLYWRVKEIRENQDLSALSMSAAQYYESDTDGVKLSLDKSTVVLYHRASDDAVLISGEVKEKFNFS